MDISDHERMRMEWTPQVVEDLADVQAQAAGTLRRCVDRSFGAGPGLTVYLIVGPPGCGKTTVARVLARELGLDFEVMHLEWLYGSGQGLPTPERSSEAIIVEDIDEFGKLNLSKIAKHLSDARLEGAGGAMIFTADIFGSTPVPIQMPKCLLKMCDKVIELPATTRDAVKGALELHARRARVEIQDDAMSYLVKHSHQKLNAAVTLFHASLHGASDPARITLADARKAVMEEALSCHGMPYLTQKLMRAVEANDGKIKLAELQETLDWPSILCQVVVETMVEADDLMVVDDVVERVNQNDMRPSMHFRKR